MTDIKIYGDQPPPYSNAPPPGCGAPYPGAVNVTVVEEPCVAQPCTVVAPVVVVGSTCPSCKMGVLQQEFTCCGICLGICFFPLGLICCLLMREQKCTHCRAVFS